MAQLKQLPEIFEKYKETQMKQNQEELKIIKQKLSEIKSLQNINNKNVTRLGLEHGECLRKENNYKLDIKILEDHIENLENKIKQSTSNLTKIHRVIPCVLSRLFIEFSDDYSQYKKNGFLYYYDMDDEFRSHICVNEFIEAFMDTSREHLVWGFTNMELLSKDYIEKDIPQLLALMTF